MYERWLIELRHGDYDDAEDFAGHRPDREVVGRDALIDLIRKTRGMFASLEFSLALGPLVDGDLVAAR